MAKLSEILGGSISSKVLGVTKVGAKSPTKDEATVNLKIIAKNFLALPSIARDLNVARQNIQKLVSLAGEKPATGADAFFLKEEEKERALEAAREKEEVTPTQVVVKEKPKGILDKLKEMFAPGKILRSLTKYFAIAAIVTTIFVAFKDTFVEWAQGLYETIKQSFDEFINDIRKWFDETIQPIIERVKEFFSNIITKISNFFTSIGEWIADKFAKIKEFFEPVVEFIKGVFDKFMVVVENIKAVYEEVKAKVGAVVEGAKNVAGKVASFLGFGKEEKPPVTPVVEEPSAVTGAPAEAMISGIEAPPEPVVPKAAKPAPRPAPSPAPLPPKPITAQPPSPTGKAAEGPEKQIGGSLTSVVSTQSGVDMSGLHPEFEKRLTAMATAFKEQTGKKLLITSAYRSNEKQAKLFNAKLKQLGGDRAKTRRLVAEPMSPLGKGRGSFHLKGLAIDINSKGPAGINVLAGDRENPTGWLEKFGLTRPVKKENWHIQPIGTLPTADNPVNPGAPTLVAGKDAKPMNLAEGKKESIGQPETTSSATSGESVASASTDLAAGQRAQQKPSTPMILNTPIVNNKTVIANQTTIRKKETKNPIDLLTARIAT